MRHAYPLMLDVTDRILVIVGGGAVAARKAAGLIEAGALRITCVAPSFHPDLPEAVRRIAETYRADHLDGAGLVFAATDSAEVNAAVVRDARGRGILVNRADASRAGLDAEPGDFVTPALLREGLVTVTVSAGSAALTAAVRDGIAAGWDDRWTQMAAAMASLRRQIVQSAKLDPDRRAAIFRDLATNQAMDVLGNEGIDGLMKWLQARYSW